MARLIDVDEIRLPQCFFEKVDNVPKFYEWLDTLPTVDAVEVVRCKDCKWFKEGKHLSPTRFCYRLKNDDGVHVGYNWVGNDFCSHGDRREDERTVAYYGDNKLIETVVIDERNDDGKTD